MKEFRLVIATDVKAARQWCLAPVAFLEGKCGENDVSLPDAG